MQHPKTSWTGYVLLAGALLFVVGTALTGGDIGDAIGSALVPALAGVGFVASADGGN